MAVSSDPYLLVAAIDFGTSYSGYAFSFKESPAKIYTKQDWASDTKDLVSLKTPTCILVNPDGKFHSFGYDAENKYTDLAQNGDHRPWYFFEKFKMRLYKSEGLSRDVMIEDMEGKPFSLMTIVTMSLMYLLDSMNAFINRQLGDFDILTDLKVVITIPAIWEDSAKQFMREAAVQTGIDVKKLLFALEPEAASIYCEVLPFTYAKVSLAERDRYMIVDLGGGTVDITVHEREGLRLKEIHKATGGALAGCSVNEAFSLFLENIFGISVIEHFRLENMDDYIDLSRQFEIAKRINKENSTRQIRIPLSLKDIYETKTGTSVKKVDQNPTYTGRFIWSQNKIKLEEDLFKEFFEKPITCVLKLIGNILQNVDGINDIFLVGGFAESVFVQEAIRSLIGPEINLKIPEDMVLAVLKGAVLYGHNPSVISNRILRFTYGCKCTEEFDNTVHPIHKADFSCNPPQCVDLFDIYAKVNTSVEIGYKIKKYYHAVKPSQTTMTTEIFISPNENPVFVTDEGCRKIGEYVLTLPPYRGKVRNCVEIVTFGETEIQIEGIDLDTGKECKTFVDLLC